MADLFKIYLSFQREKHFFSELHEKEFLNIGNKLIDIDNLNIDLIDSINPFQGAYEILSKSVNAAMLKTIQDQVATIRSTVTDEEAVLLWENVKAFKREYSVTPSLNANDAYERRLAEVLAYVRNKKAQQMQSQAQ